jgi:phosphate transport system substrate-binding protein
MKSNKSIFMLALVFVSILSILLGGCGGSPAASGSDDLSGNIAVSGAFALYPMMQRWAEEYTKLHPNVRFDVSAGGAGKGMADALAGAVDIGMVSRGITPEEEAKGAYWVPVTKDAVFPTINDKNPVLQDLLAKGVTQEILEGIYITGDITTWGQVTGKPEVTDEIHVYTRSDAAGAPEVWAKCLGDKKQEDLLGVGVFGDPGLLGASPRTRSASVTTTWATPMMPPAVIRSPGPPRCRSTSTRTVLPTPMKPETKSEAVEMVAAGKYPSPPARPLNLVTNGKPESYQGFHRMDRDGRAAIRR